MNLKAVAVEANLEARSEPGIDGPACVMATSQSMASLLHIEPSSDGRYSRPKYWRANGILNSDETHRSVAVRRPRCCHREL